MINIAHHPLLVLALAFTGLWLAAHLGGFLRRQKRDLDEKLREDLGVILAASLTLLGLIIGFSFSMATSRYDLRKNYEEAEANAIGTEYVRADLLPAGEAEALRPLLRGYLDERVAFYEAQDESELAQVNARTMKLQTQLWSAVLTPAAAHPTPITALAVAGMNDVLNSQSYTQAAFWNRIPTAAWGLMAAIAIGCNLLMGYGARSGTARSLLLPILPLLVAIAFTFIADIDSPRRGIIRVHPQNLISLAESLRLPDGTPAPASAK